MDTICIIGDGSTAHEASSAPDDKPLGIAGKSTGVSSRFNFSKFISWLTKSKDTEPTDVVDTALAEKAEFIAHFASIRFDIKRVIELASKPLPWDCLESEFQTSGAETINAQSRKAFMEWKFSSTEDCTKWIDQIPPHLTFKTHAFALSLCEGHALVRSYRDTVLGGQKLSKRDKTILTKLAARIQSMMKKQFPGKRDFFFRLDPRSPKDAVMYPGTPQHIWLKREVVKAVAHINASEKPREIKAHMKQAALASLAVSALSIKRGCDAVGLLANSERSYRDLHQALQFPNLWRMKGILREFEQIPYHGEFRLFVHMGRLTAISQYDHRLYFPQLNEKGVIEEMKAHMVAFFNKEIRDLMGKKSYIIDLGVLEDGKIKVIELNPFEPGTGPAMFSWEEDRDILIGIDPEASQNPPIRYITSFKEPPSVMFPEWEEILNS